MSDYESDDAAMLDRVRAERDALRKENERLKERLEKSESRRTHWDAVTLTNYEATKAQLAEAVKVLDGLVKHCAEAHYEDCSIMYDLDEEKCDCGSGAAHDKAREFLAKVKA